MFLEISQSSQENTCARYSFLIKFQALTCNFIKKRLWHKCFLMNFAKFLKKPFLRNTSGRLLLSIILTAKYERIWKKIMKDISQFTFTCSKLTIETVEKVWNMFKVNNKDTRTTLICYRSSHRRCSINFIKKRLRYMRPATLFIKRLWCRCFPVNFEKFLRTPFSQKTSWRLLLLLEAINYFSQKSSS